MSAVEKFPVLLSEAEEESSAVPPCFSDEGINVPSDISSSLLITAYNHTSLTRSFGTAIVSLHPTQQPLPPSPYKTQHQCHRDPPLPPQNRRSLHRVFQRAGGGEYTG